MHIRDEGIGITAEMLPHVFDLFTQAGRSPHQAQGLGVGLALVRRIVDLHGGRVSLQSAGLDEGSEFIVLAARLLARLARAHQLPDHEATAPPTPGPTTGATRVWRRPSRR